MRGAARARTERKFSGREGRKGERMREGQESASRRKKKKNWETCARREEHEKRRLRDIEAAAICAQRKMWGSVKINNRKEGEKERERELKAKKNHAEWLTRSVQKAPRKENGTSWASKG